MKTALVTGATGLLGSYLVERAAGQGWSVRALVRDAAKGAWLEALGASLVPGDLADGPSLARAARGCDVVFHAAARVGTGTDWEAFRSANVLGTERVVGAAAEAGARLVHVSSTAVYGRARYGAVPTDESTPLPELPPHDAYGRSKQDSERLVLAAHAEERLWATAVRPPVMYGLRDRQFAPRVGPWLQRGFFPLIGGGLSTLSLVHAHAVADGALRAAVSDVAAGRVYLLANDFDVTVADLVRLASEGLGRRVFAPSVPVAVGRVGFAALRVGLGVVGRRDLAPRIAGTLHMLTRDNPFTSERARRELGWAPWITPSVGLPEAFRWWKEHGSPGRRDGTPPPSQGGSFPLL